MNEHPTSRMSILDAQPSRANGPARVAIHGGEGCISGDAFIAYNVISPDDKMQNDKGGTLKHLHDRFHKIPTPGKGYAQRPQTVDSYFTCQSMMENGEVFRNRIVDVIDSGIKPCIKITTANGMSLTCTPNHPLFDGEEFVAAKLLKIGDAVFINDRSPKCSDEPKRRIQRAEIFVKHHPVGGLKVIDGKYQYRRIKRAKAAYEAHINNLSYDEYVDRLNAGQLTGLRFLEPGINVHHRDENPHNDDPKNLVAISHSEHSRHHATEHPNGRSYAHPDPITSIEPAGDVQVYDLVMADPVRNFIVDGFVVHNCGKTTLANFFPKPIDIGAENGIPRDLGFEVPVVRPVLWEDVFDVVHSLTYDDHDRETVVVDTVDWIEPLIHRFICDRDSNRETEMNKKGKPLLSIEDYGYGRGYIVAAEEFVKLLNALDILQAQRRMHVVLVMHTLVKVFKNPMGPDYERFEPKCQTHIASKVKEWAENVIFLHYELHASKVEEDKERNKASPDRARAKAELGNTQRLAGCQLSPLYDAKNRVRLPAVVPLNNPSELVAHLLGNRLGNDVQPVARVDAHASIARGAGNGIAPAARFANGAASQTPGPRDVAPRSSSEDRWGRDEQPIAPPPAPPAPTKPNLQVVPPTDVRHQDGVGIPAHHEARQDDERRRRDEAMQRARPQQDPHPNAPTNGADRAPRGATSSAADPRAEQARIRVVTEILQLAREVGGDDYMAKVKAWFSAAGTDEARMNAVVSRVRGEAEKRRPNA